ncbi:hypothetical protein KFZ56_04335 [Virgibacillus sp. NKC19-3]|uniref:hypothetical protein n=1 Tax=Virgibacillus saliphilus TaxID=2831674 RepID=UPI001C9BAEDC|nr:hypothetical protein [Virgibacillus sp. NKC19-3]MBY7142334.1 hypothetical protein [Virgibacillus sp. NKC19-3]
MQQENHKADDHIVCLFPYCHGEKPMIRKLSWFLFVIGFIIVAYTIVEDKLVE